MRSPLNADLARTAPSPIMEVLGWVATTPLPQDRPLIDLSQAAPAEPPPLAMREAMADLVVRADNVHLYGNVLGLDELRAALAARWSGQYGRGIGVDQVAITAGCNQAFSAVISSLAAAGDAVILPAPWYFNHKMWFDMQGIRTQILQTAADFLPDPERAAALITPETRAIVLVSPNNPAGVEYPASLVAAFYALARARGIALIIDQTYCDFDSRDGRPHDLYDDPDWADTLISLYSFSKSYRLTGHRVGAIIAGRERLAEIEKFLDCNTICANQLGQHAALWGLRNLDGWLAGERAEILSRRALLEREFAALEGWELCGIGGYFAYVRHPFDENSDRLARRLLAEAGLLILPGMMFGPSRDGGGSGQAEETLRIAFANAGETGLKTALARLAEVNA